MIHAQRQSVRNSTDKAAAAGLEQALNMEDRNQALLVAGGFLQKGERSRRYAW